MAKVTKKSFAKSRKKAKIDKTLERKDAIKEENDIIVLWKLYLWKNIRKSKLKMQGWVPWQERFLKKFQKMFFFGVSKGIAYLGGSEEATEKAIMVDVDGELVPEEVIVESI